MSRDVREIKMYRATPCVPTMTPHEYYNHIYQENQFRAAVPGGDPLANQTWGVEVSVMWWEPCWDGYGENYFVAIKPNCAMLRHHITPDEWMDNSTLPYHISCGSWTRRQAARLNRLLAARRYRVTCQITKWSVPGFHQTGYILTGGSLLQILRKVEGKFNIRPPLDEWPISM